MFITQYEANRVAVKQADMLFPLSFCDSNTDIGSIFHIYTHIYIYLTNIRDFRKQGKEVMVSHILSLPILSVNRTDPDMLEKSPDL